MTDAHGASNPLRVGVLGAGSVGGEVARALADGELQGAVLAGVLRRRRSPDDPRPRDTLEELLAESDLIVEAAGHRAVQEYGVRILDAGVDLLVVSVGALAEQSLLARLRASTRGRLLLSTGAIGGLDILQAAMRCGPLTEVSLESRKAASALRGSGPDAPPVPELQADEAPVEIFVGSARQAARRFPKTANVAAAVALSTVGLDSLEVRILAVPPQQATCHIIRAHGPSGDYEIRVRNATAPGNPSTSWVTPYAVLRGLSDLTRNGRFV